jgi:hypothetical protein
MTGMGTILPNNASAKRHLVAFQVKTVAAGLAMQFELRHDPAWLAGYRLRIPSVTRSALTVGRPFQKSPHYRQ